MSLFVFVAIVQAVTISIANKASVYASTRVALEKIGRTRVVARLTLIGRLVFASSAIAISIAEPVEGNAFVVTAPKLVISTWH
jgi:hypothetical protein